MSNSSASDARHHVVIVGGGFGGLYAAKALGQTDAKITLIDKRNFHLFQPLLYQVATGTVSPADISSPLRLVLSNQANTQVLLDEVTDIHPDSQTVSLKDGELHYDSLIVATGVSHHYFGNDHWQPYAPGLKTVEDALDIRRRIFVAFEAAEKESDPAKRQAWLTFVIIGGGPTGVELAGAIAEIANSALQKDFRSIDTTQTQIILVEGLDRVLPPYPTDLSAKAKDALVRLGVTVETESLVTQVEADQVEVRQGEGSKTIPTRTVLWAAGVKASSLGTVLHERAGAQLDRAGRVMVEPDLSIANHPNIFVIGDLAHFAHQGDRPLPGIAPVAMQQGQYMAKLLKGRLAGQANPPAFSYFDLGKLAVIGQNSAVVDLGFMKLSGFVAWLIWVFAHIYYLIEFDNKLIVMIQWGWNYFTRGRGARLITGESVLPLIRDASKSTKGLAEKVG
ncbi:MAG: NAD(P)/FAD-dependent oxidoreductase [Spirulina sp. SIO3F2]|nr:NAD(P)/FAD-dependent oxidoreductase [Spirulina sp. SIO3F2]